uniref:Crooked neck n=1 Tax=Tetraselmis sp. GSL018 TaxID=582737 RepID=A0A061QTJ9_9CHLO
MGPRGRLLRPVHCRCLKSSPSLPACVGGACFPQEELYLKFAEFEEKCKEVERARAIYRFALDNIPKSQVEEVFKKYTMFEKQHGDREGIEDVIVSKKRFQYEEDVQKEPLNYDVWFDYVRLEESAGDHERVREVYERAISNIPPGQEKRFWQRYIYLWINYALYEELEAEDEQRTREVYRACLKLIPHKAFTFSKIWILAAQFEIRCKRLDAARKILGMAIGMCPKEKLFRTYIDIELQLGNIDRCRTLYAKYLEWNSASCSAWSKFAELETSLGESERARSIYELAISQQSLDMPEVIWKAYIDFEIAEGNRENARALYERLLDRTKHVKVWMSFAKFEATTLGELAEGDAETGEGARAREEDTAAAAEEREAAARSVYERAYRCLRDEQPEAKEEAVLLLEAWRRFEQEAAARGGEASSSAVEAVERRLPRRIKRKRPILTDDGLEAGMEEYYDYIFPDEANHAPNLKILEAAYRWKKQKTGDES